MNSNTIIIMAGLGLAAYLLINKGSNGGSQETGKYGTKSNLANLIIAKYSSNPNWDSSYAGLMQLSYAQLVNAYETGK